MSQAALGGTLSLIDATRHVDRHSNSYSRLEMVLTLRGRMERPDWLRLLGDQWSGCDNIYQFKAELRRILGTRGPINELMTEEELVVYQGLPATITIYRGCGPKNINGASWSLARDVASAFPFFMRYLTERPLLITATVAKERVLAVKLDREEAELITFSARLVYKQAAINPETSRS